MNNVRLGLIGLGNMGSIHARNINKLRNVTLSAVCDIVHTKADSFAKELGCRAFYDSETLIRSGDVDAVLIATPHYAHTTIGINALSKGIHVLVEKPISVHKADCERLISAHTNKDLVFAAMFNQRTDPHYYKVKRLIDKGDTRKNYSCQLDNHKLVPAPILLRIERLACDLGR